MLPENRPVAERRKLKFRKGQSGNPGGRPKVLGEVRHTPAHPNGKQLPLAGSPGPPNYDSVRPAPSARHNAQNNRGNDQAQSRFHESAPQADSNPRPTPRTRQRWACGKSEICRKWIWFLVPEKWPRGMHLARGH
jgi:hypothetical protein